MSPERAQEIIKQAKEISNSFGYLNPWSDQLDQVLKPGERLEVIKVWNTMPGTSCFVDALYKIARNK